MLGASKRGRLENSQQVNFWQWLKSDTAIKFILDSRASIKVRDFVEPWRNNHSTDLLLYYLDTQTVHITGFQGRCSATFTKSLDGKHWNGLVTLPAICDIWKRHLLRRSTSANDIHIGQHLPCHNCFSTLKVRSTSLFYNFPPYNLFDPISFPSSLESFLSFANSTIWLV